MSAIDQWVVCVTGFKQSETELTGLEQLVCKLHNRQSCNHLFIVQMDWQENPKVIADKIFRHRPPSGDPEITLVGYSWGGQTCINITRLLAKHGMTVERLFLCDAVWRSRYRILYPITLLNIHKIKVPPTVKQLWTWRQTGKGIKGSKIKCLGAINQKLDRVLTFPSHSFMDELVEFHQKVCQETV